MTAVLPGILAAAPFQLYPKAKTGMKPPQIEGTKGESAKAVKADTSAVTYYATLDDFARVAYFYRAIGKEQKMADGVGDGSAHATFTFDSGEIVVISHFRPSGDPAADQTFIEVHAGAGGKLPVAKTDEKKAPAVQPIPKVIAKTEPVKASKPADSKKP